jgi:DNA repair exonuclease SbcCD ATPase subunit
MIPKRIALKNFLTFGEGPSGKPVELVFTEGEPLWVLCGPNGTGKSAVFDAITYALYGEHRGGKHKAEQLIRHNANGFEVEFDFEFGETDYRIRRTRPRKGSRTTQHLLKRVGDDWKCVRGNDPAGAVKADDIEAWVIDTLGLGYNAFTNSVLLQQGKADKLFTASRDERIEVLKGIIGFEQFEALSGRVDTAAKDQETLAAGLLARRDAIQEVSGDDLTAAGAAVKEAESEASLAQNEWAKANERVGHARQWASLEQEHKELDGKIAAADERQKLGQRIREDKQALDDLALTVPILEQIFALRHRLDELQVAAAAAKLDVETKTARRDAAKQAADTEREKAQRHKANGDRHAATANVLAGEVSQSKPFLTEAEAVTKLTADLAAFPENLDSLFDEAATVETCADHASQEANANKTRAETLLAEAKTQQTRFADVKVGAKCPLCRQPVDAAHAEEVRDELASATSDLERKLADANTAAIASSTTLVTARAARGGLQQQKTDRDTLLVTRNARQESLIKLGVTADPNDLRAQLNDKEAQQMEAEKQQAAEMKLHAAATVEAARLDGEHQQLETEAKTAEGEKSQIDFDLATARGQEQTTLGQLSEEWKGRLSGLNSDKVAVLSAERDRLIVEDVAEKFKELELDVTRRTVWESRRSEVNKQIDSIPPDDRVPEAKAKEQQASAEEVAKAKNNAHTAAMSRQTELAGHKEQRELLTTHHREAAERQRLLVRLDKLLGEAGLQRELVRDAEEQIIAYANETLQHLSDGDLSLEEDSSQESSKTFDLRARRCGGEPIGVAFLSGSQRFRVAVSVALAVGRFASGRARPLDAVIIDEGFGSLDPQGLQAMAAELKRLQQVKSLRRVVLVSHQPDFTDQFSVGYALAADESGTTATPFRR